MRFSILTYNLLYNKASKEIGPILERYQPDLIFLQELATDNVNLTLIQSYGYRLADFSNSFFRGSNIYGVATFYKPTVFSLHNSKSFSLPSSLYQMIVFLLKNRKNPRTILKNEFICHKNGAKLTTYNIHLTPVATNNLRMKQLGNTFQDMSLEKEHPVIIAGDFNYPYGRKKFEQILQRFDLKEATNNVFFTLERKIIHKFSIKLKLDYIFYKNLTFVSNERIDVRHSDHFPILTTFDLA